MMLKNIFLYFGVTVAMVLLGAGCESQLSSRTDVGNGTVDTGGGDMGGGDGFGEIDPASRPCVSGMTRYVSSRHNLTFCYPEDDGQNNEVTVREVADGVVFAVDGEDTRKIAVVDIPANANREDVVKGYFDTPIDRAVTCEAIESTDVMEGDRQSYLIVGTRSGTQTASSVAQCAESDRVEDLLGDSGQAEFIFFDEIDKMYVLSLEQDASLGQLSDEFVDSIEPKDRS